MKPVVDDRGDELALARSHGLLLDHRGDLEHVVRRQVLRPGIREVHARELLAERRELSRHELVAVRELCELVERREEEPLDRALLPVGRKAFGGRARLTAARYRARVSFGVTPRFAIAIRRTAATRSPISRTLSPSGKMMRSFASTADAVAVVAGADASEPHAGEEQHGRHGSGGALRAHSRASRSSQLWSRCAAAAASSAALPPKRCASAVVNRSSAVSTGTSTSSATPSRTAPSRPPACRARREASAAARRRPAPPRSRPRAGRPRQGRSRSRPCGRRRPAGRRVPLASETATPVRAAP